MPKTKTGNQIRQEFIQFFEERGHKFVPSASLVPGGDQTLLFTNAGMVQFKDVFLGIEKRNYSRAVNSQKCMRVAGKHNDLDDVGRDDFHHTFFEMLGNWSFGDYYKKEAIGWAWELLTEKWGLDKSRLWVTYFKDELGEIETDEEAAESWLQQPGLDSGHVLPFGRKDNFWEMADSGPCGPCSEIHYDQGEDYCDKKDDPGHRCGVNGDCHRFLELWNLVFIQYNRTSPTELDELPARHVDTGMGFERIVAVLQGVDSNYRTDLLMPLIQVVMSMTGASAKERDRHFTPYRVIADHARAASFLIADGVVPGNIGRNYICRMIIRRASRFGAKLGLQEPFLAAVAEKVIEIYGEAYPELVKNSHTILDNLTREEESFRDTVEKGLAILDDEIERLQREEKSILDGRTAFYLYATHGLPLEITRDVLTEKGLEADQEGFFAAMEQHRQQSGAGKEFGPLGGGDSEFYSNLLTDLKEEGLLSGAGVEYNPYDFIKATTSVAGLVKERKKQAALRKGQQGEIILQKTGFYIESGGQIADTGLIRSREGDAVFEVEDVRKPAPDLVVHIGCVTQGEFTPGQPVVAEVNLKRRQDIMRNHTATHLLHAELRRLLGEHVRQAGSLVAPDRLRFDFTHPRAMTHAQIKDLEEAINQRVLDNYPLAIQKKKLSEALEEGAMALFGEKYGEDVRTIIIGEGQPFSYELCGGTHVGETAEIGTFIITSEGSTAAGIRRIEAVTGRQAYALIKKREENLEELQQVMGSSLDELVSSVRRLVVEKEDFARQARQNSADSAVRAYQTAKEKIKTIGGKQVLWLMLENSTSEIMRSLADKFRNDFETGIAIFINVVGKDNIQIISTVTKDLVERGITASEIVRKLAKELGGSGGGRPDLAQGGGKQVGKLIEIEQRLAEFI